MSDVYETLNQSNKETKLALEELKEELRKSKGNLFNYLLIYHQKSNCCCDYYYYNNYYYYLEYLFYL